MVIVLALFSFMILFPVPVFAQTSCLSQAGPVVTISGNQPSRYDTRSSPLAANTKVDARGAVWTAQWPVQDSFDYPVLLEGSTNICFSGGTIQGSYPELIGADAHTTWDRTHGSAGLEMIGPNMTLEGVRTDNFGDGIRVRPGAPNFLIRNVHFTHIRDDCVSNDYLYSGRIENSLFDGCYTGLSTRPECSGCNGSAEVVTLEGSLMRLEPMQGVYKNRGLIPGHGGFFKWDTGSPSISPQLILRNNIFRADQPASSIGLGIPPGKLVECSHNTMVWLGQGNYPDPLLETVNGKPCFTITTDKSIWDRAVASWKADHAAGMCPLKSQGDADCNGTVNLVDYDYYRRIVLGDVVPAEVSSDFNADGEVGLLDLWILKATFGL